MILQQDMQELVVQYLNMCFKFQLILVNDISMRNILVDSSNGAYIDDEIRLILIDTANSSVYFENIHVTKYYTRYTIEIILIGNVDVKVILKDIKFVQVYGGRLIALRSNDGITAELTSNVPADVNHSIVIDYDNTELLKKESEGGDSNK